MFLCFYSMHTHMPIFLTRVPLYVRYGHCRHHHRCRRSCCDDDDGVGGRTPNGSENSRTLGGGVRTAARARGWLKKHVCACMPAYMVAVFSLFMRLFSSLPLFVLCRTRASMCIFSCVRVQDAHGRTHPHERKRTRAPQLSHLSDFFTFSPSLCLLFAHHSHPCCTPFPSPPPSLPLSSVLSMLGVCVCVCPSGCVSLNMYVSCAMYTCLSLRHLSKHIDTCACTQ